jgi:hypothetical protein
MPGSSFNLAAMRAEAGTIFRLPDEPDQAFVATTDEEIGLRLQGDHMLKLSVTAVATVTMLAATLVSPVTAAQMNINTGHFNSAGRSGDIGRSHGDLARIETNFATPDLPKQRKWVCGPIVNYDGTPHCHWGL